MQSLGVSPDHDHEGLEAVPLSAQAHLPADDHHFRSLAKAFAGDRAPRVFLQREIRHRGRQSEIRSQTLSGWPPRRTRLGEDVIVAGHEVTSAPWNSCDPTPGSRCEVWAAVRPLARAGAMGWVRRPTATAAAVGSNKDYNRTRADPRTGRSLCGGNAWRPGAASSMPAFRSGGRDAQPPVRRPSITAETPCIGRPQPPEDPARPARRRANARCWNGPPTSAPNHASLVRFAPSSRGAARPRM